MEGCWSWRHGGQGTDLGYKHITLVRLGVTHIICARCGGEIGGIGLTYEINDVLRRAEFKKYVTEALRVEFLAALLRDAELVAITEHVKECRDPRDDKFLSLAVNGKADCIVSGDKDLLELNPFRGIPIIPPAEFIEPNDR